MTSKQNEKVDAKVTEHKPIASTPEPVQLTVSDLQHLAKLIDLATRRGTFGAAEMTQVGMVYDKLSNFLSQVEPKAKDNTGEK